MNNLMGHFGLELKEKDAAYSAPASSSVETLNALEDSRRHSRRLRRALDARNHDLEFLAALPDHAIAPALRLLKSSKGQLRQDIFALVETDFMREGYFVEFGAASGMKLSNTYLLEKEFGWKGILAEPSVEWHEELRANRGTAIIETDCVWSKTGEELQFTSAAELSTVTKFVGDDHHAATRSKGTMYKVRTVSLVDMLKRHNAPQTIDFLSIDTEGSEFEILNAFDFDAYKFRVICCEHNRTPQRERIYGLLTSKGYQRKLDSVSRFDDWYVSAG